MSIPTQHTAFEGPALEEFLDNEPLADRAKRLRESEGKPVVAPLRKRSKQVLTPLKRKAVTPQYPLSVLHDGHDVDGRHIINAVRWGYENDERLYRNAQDLIDFSIELLAKSASGEHYGSGFDTGLTWRCREVNVLYFDRDLWKSLDAATVRTLRSLGAATIYTNASLPGEE